MKRRWKRQRWLLRVAFDIDGGLTTPNNAHAELDDIQRVLEEAGYLILDSRLMCAPLPKNVQFPVEALES